MLQIYCLGVLDIRYNGEQLLKPPTLKSQSLLAYLLLHRYQPQTRERLTAMFWGDRPEHKARHSLATAIWNIRRCLSAIGDAPDCAKDYILSDPYKLQFDPQAELWVDVECFETYVASDDPALLSEAAALYRGDFLDGFYDDWIIEERYRLGILYADALARLMTVQEANGEHEAALSTALRLLQHDAIREDAYRLAMRAYSLLGQRNLALEQYHRCQTTVRTELGVEPMIETSALYQAILEGRFPLAHVVSSSRTFVVQPGPPAGRNPLDILASSRLVGREHELEFLLENWQRTKLGSGVLALIVGEIGIGKSRLAEEFANHLRRQGAHVLWGRCYEFERLLPYQPISESLRSVLPCLEESDWKDIPAWVVREVARLVPELARNDPDLLASDLKDPILEQTRLCDGVAEFLGRLARRQPLLLVVEDLHWAGESTLQMIHYLARRLAGEPVLMLGTACEEGLNERHHFRSLRRRLSQAGLVQLLELSRLSLKAVQDILLEMSGAGQVILPLADRLFRETEGNPFFLMEIVKSLFDLSLLHLEKGTWNGDFSHISEGELTLPASLSEAIQARIDALNNPERGLLRLAAVFGTEFDFEPLNALWGRSEQATLEALNILLRQRLLDEGSDAMGRDYTFSHHKIQQVVYARLRGRKQLHRRVGDILERLQPEDAVALAWHFERADDPGKAARYALQAGLAAKAVFAHAEARDYFDRALLLLEQETPRLNSPDAIATNQRLRIQAFNERGWTLRLLGDMHTYNRDLEQVSELAKLLGDQRTLAHLRWRQAYTHRWFCRYAQARQAAEDGVRLSRAVSDLSLQALCQREIGMAARATGDYEDARVSLEQALNQFVELGDAVFEIHVLCNLATLHWLMADYERATQLSQQAMDCCEQFGLAFERRLPLGDMGAAAAGAGDEALARQSLLESLSIARQIADRTQEIFCLGHLGWLYVQEKDPDQAQGYLQEALDLAEAIDSRNEQSWLLAGLAEVYYMYGDKEQAIASAHRAFELARDYHRAYDQELTRQILDRLGDVNL